MPATFGYAPHKTFLTGKMSTKNLPVTKAETIQRGECFRATGGNEMDRKYSGWYGKKEAPGNLNADRSHSKRYNTDNGMDMGVGRDDPGGRMFGVGFGGVAGIA